MRGRRAHIFTGERIAVSISGTHVVPVQRHSRRGVAHVVTLRAPVGHGAALGDCLDDAAEPREPVRAQVAVEAVESRPHAPAQERSALGVAVHARGDRQRAVEGHRSSLR